MEDRLCPTLTLTQAGLAAGFGLSTFATSFPTIGPVGPLGIAFPQAGGVLVSDDPGNVRLFSTDTHGQSAPDVLPSQNYTARNAIGLAQLGGVIYMTQQLQNQVVQLNDDGIFHQVIGSGLSYATGIVGNPATGHLFVSSDDLNEIYDVDPVSHRTTPFITGNFDGLTMSNDDTILYASSRANGQVVGFDARTGATVFDSGFIPGSPDGIFQGNGRQAGNLYVNTNAGTVIQVQIQTREQTVIAMNGSRGDFVAVDPSDGSVLLTQTDSVERLHMPGRRGAPTHQPLPDPVSVQGAPGGAPLEQSLGAPADPRALPGPDAVTADKRKPAPIPLLPTDAGAGQAVGRLGLSDGDGLDLLALELLGRL